LLLPSADAVNRNTVAGCALRADDLAFQMRRSDETCALLPLGVACRGPAVQCAVRTPLATLRLLEALPPVADVSIPYEQRIGALRALAQKYPGDFFVQRAYQDSFGQHRTLVNEFDRAIAMYRARSADPFSRYWEARLLRWHDPLGSRAVLEQMLRDHAEFVWPHLDISDWATFPGRREDPELVSHLNAFRHACPEAFVTGMVQRPEDTRRGLERRNSPLELQTWPLLWQEEQKKGLVPDELARRVKADLRRIETWPFQANPALLNVYREAARILKDQDVLGSLQSTVDRVAPTSLLALGFAKDEWSKANPTPDRNAPQTAWEKRRTKEAQADREWLRRFPDSPVLPVQIVMQMRMQIMNGEPIFGSAEDLALIDLGLRARDVSPDAAELWPPFEVSIAQIYIAARVRLERVPGLLNTAMQKMEARMKYDLSPDLFAGEVRRRSVDWLTITTRQVEEIRVDYLLASGRASDARALIEQSLSSPQAEDPSFNHRAWLRRLGDADAQENRVQDALTHYQASLSGIGKDTLARPQMLRVNAAIKSYYLAHGGTEEKWLDWATAGLKDVKMAGRRPPDFQTAVPAFSATDLTGRTWQLGDLKGKTTFVSIWATWCGPCRFEHAGIEELYQRVKGREDVQVLTISVDDSAASVKEYMKEKGYMFPVIQNPQLADRLFPYAGLPTNFLVNGRGIRTGMYGFSPESTGVKQAMDDLVRASK